MEVVVIAERVRHLRCEECEWRYDLHEMETPEELDQAYREETEHAFECSADREALIEWVDGCVSFWLQKGVRFGDPEVTGLGNWEWSVLTKPSTPDRRYWQSLMP